MARQRVEVLCRPWTTALSFLKTVTSLTPQYDGLDLTKLEGVQTCLHAEGAMGALFVMAKQTDGVPAIVLKANKMTIDGHASSRRLLSDVCPYEVDITMFLWDLLATTGASLHVVCPYAVLRVIPPRCLNFGSKPVQVLAMEKLTGIPTLDGTFVYNLQDLIVQGIKGRIADFDVMFKTVLFQVLYTVTTWTYLTDGLFRHNDLYARNIGLSAFYSEDATPPSLSYVVYTCRTKDAPFVKTTFAMDTHVRAVVLDFGWSALLPKLGPRRDSRFFHQIRPGSNARSLSKLLRVRPVVAESGMSQSSFSHHYDCTLLMVSCYMLTLREPTARLPPVLSEFKAMYEATYSRVHESDMMHGEHLVGRLTNAAQTLLNNGSKLTCKARPTGRRFDDFVVSIPHSREILGFPFFSCFRSSCGVDDRASICLGIDMGSAKGCSSGSGSGGIRGATIRPTKVVVQTPTRQHTSKSPIVSSSASLEDECTTGAWKQSLGCYEDLLDQAAVIHEKYRRTAVRNMTSEESATWLAGKGVGVSASASASSEGPACGSEVSGVGVGSLKRCRGSDDNDTIVVKKKAVKQKLATPITPGVCCPAGVQTVYFQPVTPSCCPVPETAVFASMTPP